jgi:hypothetical protein
MRFYPGGQLVGRTVLGSLVVCGLVPSSHTLAVAARPAISVQRALTLARKATESLQSGPEPVVSFARLEGRTWHVRLAGGRTFTLCPTPGANPQYPCDPAPLWRGADVTIDARTGRAVRVLPVQFAGLAPVEGMRAEAAVRAANRQARRLRVSVRRHAYVSAVRYGFLSSFELGVSCNLTVCSPNGVYWDVTFSGMRIGSKARGIRSHYDVVIDAATGMVVMTVSAP